MATITRIKFILLALCCLAACDVNTTHRAIDKNTLVYCSEGNPESFNPQLATTGTAFDASAYTIYERLVRFKKGSTIVEPALAKRFEISQDGRSYTFYLRQGIQFHETDRFKPTRDLRAEDVLFSFNRQRLNTHPYHYVSGGHYQYFEASGLKELIEDIEIINDYTIRFRLSRPESPFLASMSMEFSSIFSKEYADWLADQKLMQKIDTDPVGTGPFKRISYQPHQTIRYQRHDKYWDSPPKIKSLIFTITQDSLLRYARFRAGECQVIAHPSPSHLHALVDQIDYQSQSFTGLNVAYLAFNTQRAPYSNPLLRKAINLAINRQAIIQAVYRGYAEPAYQPIPPSLWDFSKSTTRIEYNLTTAKNLIDQVDLPDNFALNLWISETPRPYNPDAYKMAELIQADLAKIGIRSVIHRMEFNSLLQRVGRGEHEAALLGWTADSGDPDHFFTPLLSCSAIESGSNRALWCHPKFDGLIRAAKSVNDQTVRMKNYQLAQQIFSEQLPWAPIAHAAQHLVHYKNVLGLQLMPTGGVYFGRVKLDEESPE